ncbi:PTS sugar transporter subunit IIC [Thorsellia anophelis]|uniref:Permease IIC component n=1 Tax=Thorsellia anophelis DSM 18579 TaxID=1123402 RepID=A0A1I0F6U1_9GAMM|nr:PTS transporter subunit EIIC [Thorsellia anophelis]SET53679.1 PTS system, cellobiose-specific IIC component [Thorsellia anophelis DSM 18579]
MSGVLKFVNDKIAPAANKFSRNLWVGSLQDSVIVSMPLTLVGSVITMLLILRDYYPSLPDFTPIQQFSFGLIALIIAFAFPYFAMQRKKLDNKKLLAGFTSLAIFFMFVKPTIEDGQFSLPIDSLGANGMFLGMLSGLLSCLVFMTLAKFSFFGKNSAIPDYIVASFDAFVPILVALTLSWLITFVFGVDFFALLTALLKPLTHFGQSYFGLLAFIFFSSVLYSFGVSTWLLYGLFYPIQLAGIAENTARVEQGLEPLNIHTGEVIGGFISIGGMGVTLPLAFFLLKSTSERLKAIGKVSAIPSMLNINEPIIFGTPIMLNPLMMIPFWLNAFIIPTIVYFTLKFGLVDIPTHIFNLWFVPTPFQAFLVNNDWRSFILLAVVLIVSTAIWYPFWRAYDQQQVALEKEQAEKQAA